ncbi:DUF1760-domain-containing protein [Rhizodiscina lignyota]|uniref:DUF1760-domain-containing protein n=1 Tax=Rhizodiscina lignyota TaxID=1504668 RepID=A0A9P4M9F2_9PEZI|nr:DUF1760-domain-containing protein [Rhizodiscina lignyota]
MSSESENPLRAARPPVTDYMTYLTIVEYNLTEDNLPVLHEVLQDTELTANIGWDLVLLLVPLLPASQECLQDVARLGNPREVVLKVTEALRLLDFDVEVPEPEDEDDYAVLADAERGNVQTDNVSNKDKQAALSLQFQALLSMLAVLHPRIKTKYPSRFLSTSLQAVLAAYNQSGPVAELCTESVIQFLQPLTGKQRPHIPARTSSSTLLSASTLESAPDPEASTESVPPEEEVLQQRLLQSFLTHILEDYLLYLNSNEDVPGMAWSSRLQEKLHPERIPDVPNKTTFLDRFTLEEQYLRRVSTMGQIGSIALDLKFSAAQLLETAMDKTVEPTGEPGREDDPPSTAEEVPLSKTGSLFLFVAYIAKSALYETKGASYPFSIFPEHATLLENFIGNTSPQSIGLEPEALIDALIFLGLVALENNSIGEPADDEHFNQYLQTMSLISANCLSPSLRYQAHYLTTTILRSHPDDMVRLSFIRDTLEHCPYENLKASAVSWLKGETIEANLIRPHKESKIDTHEPETIFATPVAISTVAPYLFPDLSVDLAPTSPISDAWALFRQNMTLYITTLNFYYFLLRATPLHAPLAIASLHSESDLGGSYLGPLRSALERFSKSLTDGELKDVEGDDDEVRGELGIFKEVLERIEEEVKKLNEEGPA